jgi:phospholipid/cholesterol/gamma-HCH transport system substrate-binding protein
MIDRIRHPVTTGAARTVRLRLRNRRAATIALLLLALCFYVAFVRQLPFQSHFVIRGVFSSANQLKAGNPVRISGLPVGSVTGVEPGPRNTSIVMMSLSEHAGLHADASLSIEPRLLFEGNFYVSLNPGTPASPALRSGATIPVSRTTTPVQIDQLLDVLDSPTRTALQQTTSALAAGLRSGSATAPGSTGLREAARQLAAALPPVAQVAAGLQGIAPDDLQHAIGSASDLTSALAHNPAALADLVSSSDRVLQSLSAGRGALTEDIAGLDRLTHVAPPALSALDQALPVLTQFAGRLDPALRAAPSALNDTNALFEQLRALGTPNELPAVVDPLGRLTAAAPGLEARLRAAFPWLTELDGCAAHNIVPALDAVLQDGANTTGYPAWKDLLHLGAALSGASASFDGNGVALRIGVAEGDQTASGLIPGFGQLTGAYQGEGVRPAWLGYGVVPPFRPDVRCDTQAVPEVTR